MGSLCLLFGGYKKMTINLVEAEMEQKSLTGQPVLPEVLSDMRVEKKKSLFGR